MTDTKEFQGKNLDEAIKNACDYYGVAREKLEIEIINDAKTGIFGLVGAKKATIRAARVLLDDLIKGPGEARGKKGKAQAQKTEKDRPGEETGRDAPVAGPSAPPAPDKEESAAKADKQRQRERRPKKDKPLPGAAQSAPQNTAGNAGNNAAGDALADAGRTAPPAKGVLPDVGTDAGTDAGAGAGSERPVPSARSERTARSSRSEGDARARKKTGPAKRQPEAQKSEPPKEEAVAADFIEDLGLDLAEVGGFRGEDLPALVLDESDLEHILEVVSQTVTRLAAPIADDLNCEAERRGDRIAVTIDSPAASGLLVGRDGQTLAAIHYLAARIAAKRLGGSLRLSIDAGNYRERQEDKLREMARDMAAKVRATGKAQSTRALSAYQRRIIHLTLENDPDVQTHSKGEGSQRRVIFQLKKTGNRNRNDNHNRNDNRRPRKRGPSRADSGRPQTNGPNPGGPGPNGPDRNGSE